MLFLVKVLVTCALVALMSLAARRWGPTIGGLLMGLPWMTGPVIFFLGFERGTGFAARAAVGVLIGTIGIAAFVCLYANLARRLPWPPSLAAGALAFLVSGLVTSPLEPRLVTAGAAAALSLMAAFRLVPRPVGAPVARPLPWWDIPMRVAATAVLVSLIALLADLMGPQVSGIAATFPVIFTVVGTFTHAQWGAAAVAALARGIALSLLSFTAFFFVVGSTVEAWGLVPSFLLAGGAALTMSGLMIASAQWLGGRRQRRVRAAE